MPEPDFTAITEALLRRGVSRLHTHRSVNELRDHYDDLVDEAVDSGANSRQARCIAAEQLGRDEDFIAEMASRRELKTWAFRYPQLAIVIYPLACLAVLPAVPVVAGIAHRSVLMRWGASLFGAALVTACMMLFMQLSILLG